LSVPTTGEPIAPATFPHMLMVAIATAAADAVKVIARAQHGMTTKDGPLLQQLGMQGRKAHPDTWVNIVAWTIAEWAAESPSPLLVVIPDMRFPNEAHFIRAYHGICLDVRRYHADGRRYYATDRDITHISETALDNFHFDGVIDNFQARQEEARERIVRLITYGFQDVQERRTWQ